MNPPRNLSPSDNAAVKVLQPLTSAVGVHKIGNNEVLHRGMGYG